MYIYSYRKVSPNDNKKLGRKYDLCGKFHELLYLNTRSKLFLAFPPTALFFLFNKKNFYHFQKINGEISPFVFCWRKKIIIIIYRGSKFRTLAKRDDENDL